MMTAQQPVDHESSRPSPSPWRRRRPLMTRPPPYAAMAGLALIALSASQMSGGGGRRRRTSGGATTTTAATTTTTEIRRQGQERQMSLGGLISLPIFAVDRDSRNLQLMSMDDGAPPGGRTEDVRSASHYGSAGTHFIDLWIGNPAEKRTLAVMTGSDFTAFPCGDCTDCGDTISPFDAAGSTTFSTTPCGQCASTSLPSHADVGETCTEGTGAERLCQTSIHTFVEGSSWEAYEAKDDAYIGGADLGDNMPESAIVGTDVPARHGFPFVFACQTSAKGWYSSEVKDGVVGFSSAGTSFVNQMYQAGKLRHPRFSLCFNRMLRTKRGKVRPRSPENAKSAGVVTLGGFDPEFLVTPMSFAQNVNPSHVDTSYRVYVTNLYLRERGGMSVVPGDGGRQKLRKVVLDPKVFNGRGGGAVIDSGAPFTVLDKSIEGPFLDAWRRATGGTEFKYGPQELTAEEVGRMPTILFQFRGYKDADQSINPNTVPNMAGDLDPTSPHDVLVAMPASHYMELNPNSGRYHARILFDELSGTILGANLIQGHNIAYYLDDGRIGFAESSMCEPHTTAAGTAIDAADDDTYNLAKEAEVDGWYSENGGYYVVDDDMFMAGAGSPDEDGGYKVRGHGTCLTTACRIGMSIAYLLFGCMVGLAFILYRRHRRRGRDGTTQDEGGGEESEELSPDGHDAFDAVYGEPQGSAHYRDDDYDGDGNGNGIEREVSADDFERNLMMNAQIAAHGNTNMSNFT